MGEKIKVRNLKAYSVCFIMPSKFDYGENEFHKVTIIAHTSEEAEDIFTKYAKAKNLYNKIIYISVETVNEIKRVAHMINKDFYIKQNDFVNKLYEEFKKKGEKN